MRVIAGSVGGRRLLAPPGDNTRPTSDRVKEALFSSLQTVLLDAVVVDLYAGSGGLGIEALSRGAAHATFVESDRPTLDVIRTNLDTLGLTDRATLIGASLPAAAAKLTGTFDVVLCDPPYRLSVDDLAVVLDQIQPLTSAGAAWRVERSRRSGEVSWPRLVEPGRVRRYGDTTIHEATSLDPDQSGHQG